MSSKINARQCAQEFDDGTQCKCPARRGSDFCRHHQPPKPKIAVPQAFYGRSHIQQALANILDGVASGQLNARQANSMLYGLQIATSLVNRE